MGSSNLIINEALWQRNGNYDTYIPWVFLIKDTSYRTNKQEKKDNKKNY